MTDNATFLRRRSQVTQNRRRPSSFLNPTFPNDKDDNSSFHPSDLNNSSDEDVEDDVLYPQFPSGNSKEEVDMDAFQRLIHDRARQLSTDTSSLKLTKKLSKQNQLYGSRVTDNEKEERRFILYSPEETNSTLYFEDLWSQKGQKALERVVSSSKGWWLDILCPTYDEMKILSQTFRIHPLTTEDIQAQEIREKVDLYPKYTFVCFRAIDVDPNTGFIKPYNFYSLVYEDGLVTFHFKKSNHPDKVRKRCNQLKTYMDITPEWMNYALIDSITDSFAPILYDVETETVYIDEMSLVLKKKKQAEMLKRISQCRKRSTQLVRLLASKSDVVKSLMKRYQDQQEQDNILLLSGVVMSPDMTATENNNKKSFSDVILYLGDIQDHVATMVQNINHYDRILHRAHTNYLAQMNLELAATYKMTNNVMNRLTFLATVFVPLTVICSMWGMNVNVPGQHYLDYAFFYWIIGGMALYCLACVFFGKRVGIL